MAKESAMKNIKYKFEIDTIEPGLYALHRPSKCNLKFPKTNQPIHKKVKSAYEGKRRIDVAQNGKMKKMLLPSTEKIIYPAIWHRSIYEKMNHQAQIIQNQTKTALETVVQSKKNAEESERRKEKLETLQMPQPGIGSNEIDDANNEATAESLKRAACLRAENFQGARKANQIIMASKCHAIRDAQITEKQIIKKELVNENKRLDKLMEEVRISELEKERQKYAKEKAKRLNNINYIKEQIIEREALKLRELERRQKECSLIKQTGIEVHESESDRLKRKVQNAAKLKELLDQGIENLKLKREKEEQDMMEMEARMKNFLKQRHDREVRLKLESEMKKAARAKGIDTIAKAQKADKHLREELENIRILKVQEEVERQCREKEKFAAIKRINDIKKLQESRAKQIADIRRQIAFEISKDEEAHKRVMQKTEEEIKQEEQKARLKKEAIREFKQSIISQVDEKEQKRKEYRKAYLNEGNVLKQQLELEDRLEKSVVKQKIQTMREQKIPEKYINEAERSLTKMKYL